MTSFLAADSLFLASGSGTSHLSSLPALLLFVSNALDSLTVRSSDGVTARQCDGLTAWWSDGVTAWQCDGLMSWWSDGVMIMTVRRRDGLPLMVYGLTV